MAPLRIGIVGLGKIARDQHLPSIAGEPGVALAAIASRSAAQAGVPSFATLGDMLAGAELDVVALCTPPQVRHDLALEALKAGKHVLLEKPPGATASELDGLVAEAEARGLTLFATWHSRFAAGVAPARDWLAERTIRSVAITWKEDVKRWHPGQTWIWEPGGLGVFDPGINALSIATAILPWPFFLTSSRLAFPQNCRAPIAASLAFGGPAGAAFTAEFDFRQEGPQTWDIDIETGSGRLNLAMGGARMAIDGETVVDGADAEYAGIYSRLVELVRTGASDVDLAPLRHVADAFMLGRIEIVEPFHDPALEAGR